MGFKLQFLNLWTHFDEGRHAEQGVDDRLFVSRRLPAIAA